MFQKIAFTLLVAVAVFATIAICSQSRTYHTTSDKLIGGDEPSLAIVETGDTASITTIEPLYAVMGYTYSDTFSYGPGEIDSETVAWTAPMQSMLLTIGVITATPTLIDTSVLINVQCTVQFEACTLGFDYDANANASATLEDALDSIVTVFNRTTTLKDSIVAQDSGTYIKLVSKFSEAVNTKPWSVSFISSAGSPTDSCDTASTVDTVTIAMICDSMAAAINAQDSIALYALAANSGDTAYTITALDRGLYFFDSTLNPADTHGTVTRTQANVTSKSRSCDTIHIANMIYNDVRFTGLYGYFVLDSALTGTQGIGASDSAYLILYGANIVQGNKVLIEVARDSANSLPCTLRVAKPALEANDTLFGEQLWLTYVIADTASDTTANYVCSLHVDMSIFGD